MSRFWKGIIVGLGGVAPGLSGSVLLIIFGLYQKTLDALGTLFARFKKNIAFLLPLVAGMFLGVLLFSKVINFLLNNHEMPTRFCFLGLILGTLPMVWKEVRKNGFKPIYYAVIAVAAGLGIWFFTVNPNAFPQVTDPTLLQSILLGVAVAATAIIPGVDPAVFLSTLGFYEMYVAALANLEWHILLPMVVGLALGAVGISFGMSLLFKRWYTATFSVIFGIFLSMIPNMLSENCVLGFNGVSVLSVILLLVGFAVSFVLGDLDRSRKKLRQWREKKELKREMLRLIGVYDYTVILTYLSLLSAVVGMVSASHGKFTAAVLCLLFSGLCDAFDGIVARSKKNRTEDEKSFGIQLDSLCDVISFGVFPAFLCYHCGVDGVVGLVCVFVFCLCAVIRLAFFNVLEGNRQRAEGGCNRTYRGLPVTAASIIFPFAFCFKGLLSANTFAVILHILLVVVAFLFVLDFSVKKPDWQKLLTGKKSMEK